MNKNGSAIKTNLKYKYRSSFKNMHTFYNSINNTEITLL